jgi:hypothetical protein
VTTCRQASGFANEKQASGGGGFEQRAAGDFVPIRHRDGSALFEKKFHACGADALRPAADEHNFVGESEVHGPGG